MPIFLKRLPTFSLASSTVTRDECHCQKVARVGIETLVLENVSLEKQQKWTTKIGVEHDVGNVTKNNRGSLGAEGVNGRIERLIAANKRVHTAAL